MDLYGGFVWRGDETPWLATRTRLRWESASYREPWAYRNIYLLGSNRQEYPVWRSSLGLSSRILLQEQLPINYRA